jgi:hypothetical protein
MTYADTEPGPIQRLGAEALIKPQTDVAPVQTADAGTAVWLSGLSGIDALVAGILGVLGAAKDVNAGLVHAVDTDLASAASLSLGGYAQTLSNMATWGSWVKEWTALLDEGFHDVGRAPYVDTLYPWLLDLHTKFQYWALAFVTAWNYNPPPKPKEDW